MLCSERNYAHVDLWLRAAPARLSPPPAATSSLQGRHGWSGRCADWCTPAEQLRCRAKLAPCVGERGGGGATEPPSEGVGEEANWGGGGNSFAAIGSRCSRWLSDGSLVDVRYHERLWLRLRYGFGLSAMELIVRAWLVLWYKVCFALFIALLTRDRLGGGADATPTVFFNNSLAVSAIYLKLRIPSPPSNLRLLWKC